MVKRPPKEDDTLTLWVKKKDNGSEIVDTNTSYTFNVLGDLGLDYGEKKEIELKVVDKWYTKSGEVQRIFLEYHGAGDGEITDINEGEDDEKENEVENPLSEIAEKKLGDEEFKITSEESSSIGEAKREAMKQQRDPAIDPEFNKLDSTDEDN